MALKLVKTLSKNDTGETGSHQAGIRVPYDVARTPVFPQLPSDQLNPRQEVIFYDEQGCMRKFMFIYYNDELFGKGRRGGHNEYRLTCVRQLLVEYNAKAGDEMWFSIDDDGVRHVGLTKKEEVSASDVTFNGIVIKKNSAWKTINF